MIYFNILLLGFCAILGLALVGQFQDAKPVSSEARSSVGTSQKPEVKTEIHTLSALDAFSVITERPLFMVTRHPPEAEAPEATPVETRTIRPPDVSLIGTVSVGESRRALIEMERMPPELYRIGQSVSGWRITGIGEDRIELGFGENRHTVAIDGVDVSGGDTTASGEAQETPTLRRQATALPLDMTDAID